ncbi:MAG: ligand-binding sensor domain-containing protein [Crocinitomicaceae bacterium]|jgi:ligand-binding sensor domain-containing protein
MNLKFIFLLIFCLTPFLVPAQNSVVKNFTPNDGLTSSQVYDVIQDDHGYLWFSTDKGLSRYNGYEFENFSTADGLTDNVIFNFLKTPDGKIWCTTNSSTLFTIEGAHPKFNEYRYNDTLRKYANNLTVKCTYFDDENSLLLSFHNMSNFLAISSEGKILSLPNAPGGIANFDKRKLHITIDDNSEPFFFAHYSEVSSNQSKIDSYSLIGVNGSYKNQAIHFGNHQTSVFILDHQLSIQNNQNVRNISLEKEAIASGKLNDDLFWVGFRYGGVTIYSVSGELQEHLFTDASVTQLYLDNQNNYWATTLNKGIFYIRNIRMQYLPETKGLAVNSISKGNGGGTYIGYYNGNIDHINSQNKLNRFYTPKIRRPARIIYALPSKTNFFSSDIIFSLDNSLLRSWNCSSISLTDNNTLLCSASGLQLVNISNLKSSQPTLFERIRIKDAIQFNSRIYASSINGIYYTDILNKNREELRLFSDTRIDDLEVWGENLVLGTHGKGVQIINKKHDILYSIDTKNGLSSDFVSHIFPENDSTLWISTNSGVNRIRFSSNSNSNYAITKITTAEGLLSNEVWAISVHNQTIWIGTQNGVNCISTTDFHRPKKNKKSYYLQWKTIRNNGIATLNKEFSHDENKFEFQFLGISLRGGDELIYRYKLEGYSDHWTTATNRKIAFSYLPPGNYKMIVQVKEKNEKWSDEMIRYSFNITPPYWETWWFISLCILLSFGMIYLFFKVRVLTYNKDIVREILRHFLQLIRKDAPTVFIKHNGRQVKLKTADIHFIKTSGNYLEIHTNDSSYLVRSSFSKFMGNIPDSIEFLQVHRSYIIRLDKVTQKGIKSITVLNEEIPVGRSFNDQLNLIQI